MPRARLDQLLLARGLVPSRARARDLILRGKVRVDGRIAAKAGQLVTDKAQIELPNDELHLVSRGALKLAAALEAFGFDPRGLVCLDVGASTGGFSQILLERGAAKVYAVDVGHGQLNQHLARDPRLINMEGVDARRLDPALIGENIDMIVCDVSFIGLSKALPAAPDLARRGAMLVALIKPQFEVGSGGLGKGGIVRDEALLNGAVHKLRDWLQDERGWRIVDLIRSPIKGGSGNREFLIGAVNDRQDRDE